MGVQIKSKEFWLIRTQFGCIHLRAVSSCRLLKISSCVTTFVRDRKLQFIPFTMVSNCFDSWEMARHISLTIYFSCSTQMLTGWRSVNNPLIAYHNTVTCRMAFCPIYGLRCLLATWSWGRQRSAPHQSPAPRIAIFRPKTKEVPLLEWRNRR